MNFDWIRFGLGAIICSSFILPAIIDIMKWEYPWGVRLIAGFLYGVIMLPVCTRRENGAGKK